MLGGLEIWLKDRVFNMFRLEDWDILFLQETHCTCIKEARVWSDSIVQKALWSVGKKHSGGVGICFRAGLNFHLVNFDFEGRYLVVDVDINNVEFCLINIYAPNNHVQRKIFMSDLCKFMVTRQNIILGESLIL